MWQQEFTEMETKIAGDGTMQEQQVKMSWQKAGSMNLKGIERV